LRKLKTWSQEQLAEKAEVTTKAVWKAEKGQSISLENADCIARALGQKVVDLVSDANVSIEPTTLAAKTERLRFTGEIDAPAELIEIFRRERYAFKFFVVLHLSELLKDGALNIELDSDSILVSAALTPDDILRITTAFIAGKLKPLGLLSLTVSTYKSLPTLSSWQTQPAIRGPPVGAISAPVLPHGQPPMASHPMIEVALVEFIRSKIKPPSFDQSQLAMILDYFRRLTPAQQAMLFLVFSSNSLSEAAHRVGLPVHTVKQTLLEFTTRVFSILGLAPQEVEVMA
jgi:transcriptional regulator with XRE-family HTH domain